MAGQYALIKKKKKSVGNVKIITYDQIECHICRQSCFLYFHVRIFRISLDNFLDNGKSISLRGGGGSVLPPLLYV